MLKSKFEKAPIEERQARPIKREPIKNDKRKTVFFTKREKNPLKKERNYLIVKFVIAVSLELVVSHITGH